MRQVIQWIKEYALADEGSVPGEVLGPRIAALNELATNMHGMSAEQFKEVMTTAHFTYYFADALSRSFYKDYAYQIGSWKSYIFQDEAPDFRDVYRFRMTEPAGLEKRREKAEPKPTSIVDSQIYYGVDEYARQFDVSWRTLMNDDLGKIKETPQRMVRSAVRWLDAFVSNLYDNATTQGTLAPLGAPWAGTGRLTAANLAVGINGMMQRTDVLGNQMQINRVHLVIPPILQIQAKDILEDILSYGGPGGNVLNGFIAGVYVDPYITTAAPNVPWYLFADPSEIPTVTVARLTGWPGPIVAMKQSNIQMVTGTAPSAFLMGSFATGDIEFMVEDVVGAWDDASYVGVTDFRGLYYSSGTTP